MQLIYIIYDNHSPADDCLWLSLLFANKLKNLLRRLANASRIVLDLLYNLRGGREQLLSDVLTHRLAAALRSLPYCVVLLPAESYSNFMISSHTPPSLQHK